MVCICIGCVKRWVLSFPGLTYHSGPAHGCSPYFPHSQSEALEKNRLWLGDSALNNRCALTNYRNAIYSEGFFFPYPNRGIWRAKQWVYALLFFFLGSHRRVSSGYFFVSYSSAVKGFIFCSEKSLFPTALHFMLAPETASENYQKQD